MTSAPAPENNWRTVPLWSVARRTDRRGRPESELLSVYRDHGVVPKSSRDDNFNKPSEDLSSYRWVEPGDLVLNKMKTWQGSLAVSGFEGIVSPAYYVCSLDPSVDPRFMHFLLRSGRYIAKYAALSKGIRPNQWDLPYDEFKSISITLPPLDVQRQIADFLDDQTTRIDKAIQLRQRQVVLAREEADATVANLILGGGRQVSAKPWFVGIPKNRRLQPLRALWKVIDCKHRTPNYLDEGIPVISPGDINPGDLDLSVAHRFVGEADYLDLADQLRRCSPGDLVYSRNASAGTAAFVNTNSPFTMGQDVCRITSSNENQKFLFHALNNIVLPQLDAVRVGSTFTRINVDQIKALVVPVPPSSEQLEIASRSDAVRRNEMRLLESLGSSIALLHERKRSLITGAVTGEFDVSSASSRAAGVATNGI